MGCSQMGAVCACTRTALPAVGLGEAGPGRAGQAALAEGARLASRGLEVQVAWGGRPLGFGGDRWGALCPPRELVSLGSGATSLCHSVSLGAQPLSGALPLPLSLWEATAPV